MSITRKMLEGMSLTDYQIESVMEGHLSTVNGLKDSIEELTTKLEESTKAFETLKKQAESNGHSEWEDKFVKLTAEFDEYKNNQQAKETKAKKAGIYKELLKKANVSEKTIDAVLKASSNVIDELVIGEDGKIQDEDAVVNGIKEAWSGFIVEEDKKGANTKTPPRNDGSSSITKEMFDKMSYREKLHLYGTNKDLYDTLKGE